MTLKDRLIGTKKKKEGDLFELIENHINNNCGYIYFPLQVEYSDGSPDSEHHEPFNPQLDLPPAMPVSISFQTERPTPEQLEALARRRLNRGFIPTKVPDPPLMDRKYPHNCHECHKGLEYKHVFNEACKKYRMIEIKIEKIASFPYTATEKEVYMQLAKKCYTFEKQFKKWWRSKYVKFLCCSCYRKATQPTIGEHLNHLVAESEGHIWFIDNLSQEHHEEP